METDPRGRPLLDPLPPRDALRLVWRNVAPGRARGYCPNELYQLNCLVNQAARRRRWAREALAARQPALPSPGTSTGARPSS